MASRLFAAIRILLWAGVAALLFLVGYALLRPAAQDLPWTPLKLDAPIGLFTGRKLTALTRDPAACRRLLDRAGIAYRWLAPVEAGAGALSCGYADAVRLRTAAGQAVLTPRDVAPSCPVVLALKLWEWRVVQPAAKRRFGAPVRRIETFGAYSCRRLYGRGAGDRSEHATADAVDVAAFVLADGRRIGVAADWTGSGEKAAFLHEVRDGARAMFATTLSPDYNAAHSDHLHLDQAERGATGWRACR